MTLANEPDDQAQQTRWREWQAAYARASRRSATRATIVFIIVFSGIGAVLLLQLFALPRVV